MDAVVRKSANPIWLILLLLVLGSNLLLYRTEFGGDLLSGASESVVLGSLIDLAIVVPLLFLAWRRSITLKGFLLGAAAGLIAARFLIPAEWLGSYAPITYLGFAAEGAFILLELVLVVSLFVYLPKILRTTREDSKPLLFAFPAAVDSHIRSHPIVHAFCSEMLMFHYAFGSWKKKLPLTEDTFTLHRKTGHMAMQIMIIHGIIIETIGIHWWLHEKSLVLSIILLFLNVYSVIYLIADMQAVRLSPAVFGRDRLYLSLGMAKRMEIRYSDIAELVTDGEELSGKLSKDTAEFISRDFDAASPDILIKLKQPVAAILFMGIRKPYRAVAVKVDEKEAFFRRLKTELDCD
ncbi:beta-carotene 15,15'-monooxygenase [Bhargavaea beijingensis]|uniref:beta-carotene 15,15'-monooxygenase n=1 Tax=Bhargavaea beijingensis TaxID=426756 RepID=UPI002225A62A|nr:beta-carotene 15,15'-monooxygenase [Bhargavaea beijingensis]MCW1929217.1 beta-carotene 15,15'-monooxygenase [Bhargavaea beijingensis]